MHPPAGKLVDGGGDDELPARDEGEARADVERRVGVDHDNVVVAQLVHRRAQQVVDAVEGRRPVGHGHLGGKMLELG